MSAFGTKRTSRWCWGTSAFGGKRTWVLTQTNRPDGTNKRGNVGPGNSGRTSGRGGVGFAYKLECALAGGQFSCGGFDSVPGVVILELCWA
jgi:hypothetical protein